MRLVLDTNVLISALLFPQGSLFWMREAWQYDIFVPLVSSETSFELVRVLSYSRFNLSNDDLEAALNTYLPWVESVDVPSGLIVPNPRDPNDRPFLELALAGNADALVTGDNDLLVLAGGFPVPIMTPRELKGRLFAEL